MTHILRRFYKTALECTRRNNYHDGFISKNVIVFSPFMTHYLSRSHFLRPHHTLHPHKQQNPNFSISTLSLFVSLNVCLQNHTLRLPFSLWTTFPSICNPSFGRIFSQGGAMSALLSLPSNSTSFWRSPRRFAATTMYNIAISSTYIVQSRTTIATRTTLARCSDFPLPLHSLPEKHSSGFPASTLSGRFTKNSMSGTRPVNLLYEMFSTTRFCRPARYWRFPLRTLWDMSLRSCLFVFGIFFVLCVLLIIIFILDAKLRRLRHETPSFGLFLLSPSRNLF